MTGILTNNVVSYIFLMVACERDLLWHKHLHTNEYRPIYAHETAHFFEVPVPTRKKHYEDKLR